MNRKHRDTVRGLHQRRSTHELNVFCANLLQFGLWILAAWTWFAGYWPLTVAVWVLAAHHSHTQLLRFHEAAHGLLSPNRFLNELRGHIIGIFCLVPLSVYRVAHHAHHAYLATERDGELWPFTDPRTSRPFRLVMMVAELSLGFFVKPFLFLRFVLTERLTAQQRRRILWEYAVCITFWTSVLVIVVRNGWWEVFIVAYLVPAVLAGCLQSLRLYIEHMGMLGNSPLSLSRTVVAKDRFSRLLSWTMLYADSHGTHHQFGQIPYDRIPEATAHVYAADGYEPRRPVFDNYWQALRDMLPALADPKVGPQWLAEQAAESGTQNSERPSSNTPVSMA